GNPGSTSSRFFFFSSRRRHTRSYGDWSSDVCSSDLEDCSQPVMLQLCTDPGEGRRNSPFVPHLWHVGLEESILGLFDATDLVSRSEERRVGKEGRSRRSPEQ